jgi:3'-phosphoadenosine 5'-phosphosulfate sulfotransferase (PAPS reductase)/FAD synthetase
MVNPIVDWTDEEVWEYIHARNLPYCELYDQGYTRIGCIGCPLAGAEKMRKDFERYPKYRDNYIRAFDRMIKAHPGEIKIATGEPAENGGGNSEHGSSGAEMVHRQESVAMIANEGGVDRVVGMATRNYSKETGSQKITWISGTKVAEWWIMD